MKNTRFETGCNLPGLESLVIGQYGASLSKNNNQTPAMMVLLFTFDTAEERNKYRYVRIEQAGEGYLARLMQNRAPGYLSKGETAAVKLGDYNNSTRQASAGRAQSWLGLDDVMSEMGKNTAVISCISEAYDDYQGNGPEMHVYFTVEAVRNVSETTTTEPLLDSLPAAEKFIIDMSLPADVIAKLLDVAKIKGQVPEYQF